MSARVNLDRAVFCQLVRFRSGMRANRRSRSAAASLHKGSDDIIDHNEGSPRDVVRMGGHLAQWEQKTLRGCPHRRRASRACP